MRKKLFKLSINILKNTIDEVSWDLNEVGFDEFLDLITKKLRKKYLKEVPNSNISKEEININNEAIGLAEEIIDFIETLIL